jgi:hypothetical protein
MDEPKSIMINEQTQSQQCTHCNLQPIGHPRRDKTILADKRSVVAKYKE